MVLKVKLRTLRIFVILILLSVIALYINSGSGRFIGSVQSTTGEINLNDYLKGAPSDLLQANEISSCPLKVPVKGRIFCGVQENLQRQLTFTFSFDGSVQSNIFQTRKFEDNIFITFPDAIISNAQLERNCFLGIFCSSPTLIVRDISTGSEICKIESPPFIGDPSLFESTCNPGTPLVQDHTYTVEVEGGFDIANTFVQIAGRQPRLWYSNPLIGQEPEPIPATEGCKYQGWADKVKELERPSANIEGIDTPTINNELGDNANDAKSILESEIPGQPSLEIPGSFEDIAPEYFAEIPESSIFKEGPEDLVRVVRYGTSWNVNLFYLDVGSQPNAPNIWIENGITYAAFCDSVARKWIGYIKDETPTGECFTVADESYTFVTEAQVLQEGKTFCCNKADCPSSTDICSLGRCEEQGTAPVTDACLTDTDCKQDRYPTFGNQAFEDVSFCNKDEGNPYFCDCPDGDCYRPIGCDPDADYAEGVCCRLVNNQWTLVEDRVECGLAPLAPLDCRQTFGADACCNVGDGLNQAPEYTQQPCEGENICCGGDDGVGLCKEFCGSQPSKGLFQQFVDGLKSLLGTTEDIASFLALILIGIAILLLIKIILPGIRPPKLLQPPFTQGPGPGSGFGRTLFYIE